MIKQDYFKKIIQMFEEFLSNAFKIEKAYSRYK